MLHSGLLVATALAICWSRMVLPDRGGATISPRWPLPTGQIRSSTRISIGPPGVSSLSCGCGSTTVRSLNGMMSVYSSAGRPLTVAISSSLGPPLLLGGRLDLALDEQARAQAVAADEVLAHEDVAGGGAVVVLGLAEETVALLGDLQHARTHRQIRLAVCCSCYLVHSWEPSLRTCPFIQVLSKDILT